MTKIRYFQKTFSRIIVLVAWKCYTYDTMPKTKRNKIALQDTHLNQRIKESNKEKDDAKIKILKIEWKWLLMNLFIGSKRCLKTSSWIATVTFGTEYHDIYQSIYLQPYIISQYRTILSFSFRAEFEGFFFFLRKFPFFPLFWNLNSILMWPRL